MGRWSQAKHRGGVAPGLAQPGVAPPDPLDTDFGLDTVPVPITPHYTVSPDALAAGATKVQYFVHDVDTTDSGTSAPFDPTTVGSVDLGGDAVEAGQTLEVQARWTKTDGTPVGVYSDIGVKVL